MTNVPDDGDPFTAKLKWIAFVVSSAAAIVTSWVILSGYMPETRAHAQEAYANTNQKLADHEQRLETVERRLGSIDRNGLRSLNLQLRSALRSLDADLKNLTENSPGRRNLEEQRDRAALDLRENQMQLETGR